MGPSQKDSCEMSKPISIQLYSVREAMGEDPWGTLKKIADMGYVGVEPCGVIANDLDTMVKCIADLGMVVSSYQAGQPAGDNANKLMDEAEALGCTRIVHPHSNHELWKTMAGLDELAVSLNEAVENTAKRGMTFGYHNHDFEMVLVDGEPALLQMAKKVPGMHYTVDTYWVLCATLKNDAGLCPRGEILHQRSSLSHDHQIQTRGGRSTRTASCRCRYPPRCCQMSSRWAAH